MPQWRSDWWRGCCYQRCCGPRRAETARQAIAALATCNPQSRLTGLAALLRDYGGTAPPKLDAALYDPAVRFDPAPLETAILKAARSRAR